MDISFSVLMFSELKYRDKALVSGFLVDFDVVLDEEDFFVSFCLTLLLLFDVSDGTGG